MLWNISMSCCSIRICNLFEILRTEMSHWLTRWADLMRWNRKVDMVFHASPSHEASITNLYYNRRTSV